MDQRLSKAAESLSDLVGVLPSRDLGPLLDLAIGGLLSLILAQQSKYLDRKAALTPIYYEGLSDRARKMASGTVPSSGPWLAGYHFNSGLMRLGAAREQTRGLLKSLVRRRNDLESMPQLTRSEIDDLQQDVNSLKHDLLGLAHGRRVTFEQAILGLLELVEVLEAWKSELSSPHVRFPKVTSGRRHRVRAKVTG